MCSIHPRLKKKYQGVFEELRAAMETELTDADYFRLKSTKRQAGDEFMTCDACSVADRIMKTLSGPTPAQQSVMQVQSHTDNIIKVMRG